MSDENLFALTKLFFPSYWKTTLEARYDCSMTFSPAEEKKDKIRNFHVICLNETSWTHLSAFFPYN
jgi:hypothetical protein